MPPIAPVIWYGVLFAPPKGPATAERPPLPEWAAELLADFDGEDQMTKAMADRGYTGDKLTWIGCQNYAYWGLGIAASVLRAENGYGTIRTSVPTETEQRWVMSITRAVFFLGGTGTCTIDWYQSA